MYMPNINLPLDAELLRGIDADRGEVARTRWIRRAIELRLAGQYRQGYGPAVENIRSSGQAKADVKPIPKGVKK